MVYGCQKRARRSVLRWARFGGGSGGFGASEVSRYAGYFFDERDAHDGIIDVCQRSQDFLEDGSVVGLLFGLEYFKGALYVVFFDVDARVVDGFLGAEFFECVARPASVSEGFHHGCRG